MSGWLEWILSLERERGLECGSFRVYFRAYVTVRVNLCRPKWWFWHFSNVVGIFE